MDGKIYDFISMEGEINNYIFVWSTVIVSLCYCHTVDKFFPKGIIRALAILPVACLFIVLPLKLTTIYLGGTTSFFIGWLASFKLILFAFKTGPLAFDPPPPLSRFIALACLPIEAPKKEIKEKGLKSTRNYITKLMLFVMCIRMYEYTDILHPKIVWFLYAIHLYLALDMLLALVGALSGALIRVDLEPQFDEPYLSTSIQDFWGRRWNLMVSKILRPTIYNPVRLVCARYMGWTWAALPAVLSTFLVSGLMHELVFYTFGRVKPTGVLTSFFLLHGASLAVEMVIKKMACGKFRLPGIVSGSISVAYVIFTSFWLFFPPFLENQGDVKACKESLAFIQSVKEGRLISPNNVTCPFFS